MASFNATQLGRIYTKKGPQVESDGKHVLLSSQQLSVATMNSIRRTMLLDIPTLGFTEHIDPNDYDMLNNVLNLELKGERHTVIRSTVKFPIPMLAHRLSRIPINSIPEMFKLLRLDDEDIHVFFVLAKDGEYAIPMDNGEDPVDVRLYARSLQPLVIRRTQQEDGRPEYTLDRGLMSKISGMMRDIFPMNTFLLPLAYGQQIHAILKPVIGKGAQDPRWSPCTYHYRFNRDARHAPEGMALPPIRLHKQPEQPGIRLQFAQIPVEICKELGLPNGMTYDRFRKPFEIELMSIYNGRMPPKLALQMAVEILDDAVTAFLREYKKDHSVQDAMSHVAEEIHVVVKEMKGDTQTVYVPFNTNDPLPEEYQMLTTHTIGNLLASKMLYMVDREIIRNDMLDAYENILIAYKVPHHLVQQCTFTIQLPTDNQAFVDRFVKAWPVAAGKSMHDTLVESAVIEISRDLASISEVAS